MEDFSSQLPEDLRETWKQFTSFDPSQWTKPNAKATIAEFKGHRLQPTFPAEGIEYAYDNWTPNSGDVIVASFPRTGTNWTTEIVRQILYGRDEETLKKLASIPVPLMFYEAGGPSKFKLLDHLPFPRRYMATHLPSTLINVENIKKANAKVVCVVRNPKDQAVSWFHFVSKLPYMQLEPVKEIIDCEWPKFLENYTSGKIPLGMRPGEWYLDHLKGWYEQKDDKNVMFVCFEEMKKDLPKEVRRLAIYLGVELSEEEVMSICEKCGFKGMKKATDNAGSKMEKIRSDLGVLRRGEVGGWKDMFTVSQSELIDAQVAEKLAGTDIQFTYTI
ncbi:sulfotransferase 1B1 [Ciona intestinalis]